MLKALNIHNQVGRTSVKFGAKYTVIPVATILQTSPQADKVEGVTLFGIYETTSRQNL